MDCIGPTLTKKSKSEIERLSEIQLLNKEIRKLDQILSDYNNNWKYIVFKNVHHNASAYFQDILSESFFQDINVDIDVKFGALLCLTEAFLNYLEKNNSVKLQPLIRSFLENLKKTYKNENKGENKDEKLFSTNEKTLQNEKSYLCKKKFFEESFQRKKSSFTYNYNPAQVPDYFKGIFLDHKFFAIEYCMYDCEDSLSHIKGDESQKELFTIYINGLKAILEAYTNVNEFFKLGPWEGFGHCYSDSDTREFEYRNLRNLGTKSSKAFLKHLNDISKNNDLEYLFKSLIDSFLNRKNPDDSDAFLEFLIHNFIAKTKIDLDPSRQTKAFVSFDFPSANS